MKKWVQSIFINLAFVIILILIWRLNSILQAIINKFLPLKIITIKWHPDAKPPIKWKKHENICSTPATTTWRDRSIKNPGADRGRYCGRWEEIWRQIKSSPKTSLRGVFGERFCHFFILFWLLQHVTLLLLKVYLANKLSNNLPFR